MNQTQAEKAFNTAIELQQQGKIDEAGALYADILQTHRNHHHALHLLGVIASQRGNHFYARRLMESSAALEPDNADVLANLAHVLFYLGEYAESLQHCEASLAIQPGNPICHMTRGKALRFLGRHEEAIQSLDESLRLKPDLAESYMHRGFCKHKLLQLEKAIEDYDHALRLRPENAEVLSNRGHALFALEQQAEALQSIERALQIFPDYPEALYHMGLIKQQEKKYDEALAYYSRAVKANPNYHQALVRLAFVMHKLKMLPQESLAVLDRVLLVNPNDVDSLKARAGLLSGLKLVNQSLSDYDRAIELEPNDPKVYADRAETLLIAKRNTEAAQSFKRALELGGDKAELTYALASLGEDVTPVTAPVNYVTTLFDWYADRFDEHLQGRLKYQTPALLCQEIMRLEPGTGLNVLDLGCGTGLCGPLLKPMASSMTGVDLSANMLEMARKRGLYDTLVCADLTAFVTTQTQQFELVVATDVFIYVGALEAVFAATRNAMRAQGLFAFSFETSASEDLVLRPTRRYAHSVAYIQKLAAAHGFSVLVLEPSVIREEGGENQDGYLAVLRLV
jgi:predicted TPR repeat methyltransferase